MADPAPLTPQFPQNGCAPRPSRGLPTSEFVSRRAALFPPLCGWMRCTRDCTTNVTLNGAMLSHERENFPVLARVRLYDGSTCVAEHLTPEIGFEDFHLVRLNDFLGDREIHDGYYELAVLPVQDVGMKTAFFNEVWAQVYSADGRIAVEYPLLIGRGADPSMIDSSYLYYPGMTDDDRFQFSLVALNHQDFENHYEVILYNAAGTATQRTVRAIPPKSLQNTPIDVLFPNARAFLADGPGMLVYHFKYKMNAFIQTWQRGERILSGMDHVGLLFGQVTGDGMMRMVPEADPETVHANREADHLVCYCKKITEGALRGMLAHGQRLHEIQQSCGAGTVCLGCVPDLEQMAGEVAQTTWNVSAWDATAIREDRV